MSTRTTLTPSPQVLLETPVPNKTEQNPTPPSAKNDDNTHSALPQDAEFEDEYTLSAYGEISLSEIQMPEPTDGGPNPLRSRGPQPRLRLRVRRPLMPKHRMSFSYSVPDPLPFSDGFDERWPGSPRSNPLKSPYRLQPLVSPVSALSQDLVGSASRSEASQPAKANGSSVEKLVKELLPSPPSIRLSPPTSLAKNPGSLPREPHEQKNNSRSRRNVLKKDNATKPVPQSAPAPRAPQQDKPKPTPWRTRLPPRPPIPRWDI